MCNIRLTGTTHFRNNCTLAPTKGLPELLPWHCASQHQLYHILLGFLTKKPQPNKLIHYARMQLHIYSKCRQTSKEEVEMFLSMIQKYKWLANLKADKWHLRYVYNRYWNISVLTETEIQVQEAHERDFLVSLKGTRGTIPVLGKNAPLHCDTEVKVNKSLWWYIRGKTSSGIVHMRGTWSWVLCNSEVERWCWIKF